MIWLSRIDPARDTNDGRFVVVAVLDVRLNPDESIAMFLCGRLRSGVAEAEFIEDVELDPELLARVVWDDSRATPEFRAVWRASQLEEKFVPLQADGLACLKDGRELG